jgi:hypothetical protein
MRYAMLTIGLSYVFLMGRIPPTGSLFKISLDVQTLSIVAPTLRQAGQDRP